MQPYLQMVFSSLTLISVYTLATMGVVLIFKTSFTTNFAQGSIAALGCYIAARVALSLQVSIWMATLIAVFIAFLIGIFIDFVIFRQGKNVNALGKQIITMGLVLMILGIIPTVFGSLTIQIDRFFTGTLDFALFGMTFTVTKHALFCFALATLILTAIFLALKFTKWGLGVRATASNEKVAQMMGINTKVITAMSWAIAAGLGTVAAIMYGSGQDLNPSFMGGVQVNAFLACILGGLSTFYGPIVGAVLIPVFSNIFRYNFSAWADVIVYALILIVILIKPLGIFGKKIAKKV